MLTIKLYGKPTLIFRDIAREYNLKQKELFSSQLFDFVCGAYWIRTSDLLPVKQAF